MRRSAGQVETDQAMQRPDFVAASSEHSGDDMSDGEEDLQLANVDTDKVQRVGNFVLSLSMSLTLLAGFPARKACVCSPSNAQMPSILAKVPQHLRWNTCPKFTPLCRPLQAPKFLRMQTAGTYLHLRTSKQH